MMRLSVLYNHSLERFNLIRRSIITYRLRLSQEMLNFKRLIMIWVGLSFALGCDVAPPSFVELSTPRGSIDSLGPYAFTVEVAGAVDSVNVVWVRATPTQVASDSSPSLSDPDDQQRLILRREGEIWVGEIAGGEPIATYS